MGLLQSCSDSAEAYWPTGIRRHAGEGRPGAERGLWVYRYFDGNMRARGHYDASGQRVGRWETWFRTGQRDADGERQWDATARAALRTGPWTFWHENGRVRSQGEYVAGLREGPWEFWRPGGQPDASSTGTYTAGVLNASGVK